VTFSVGIGRCVTLREVPRPDGTRRYSGEQIAAAGQDNPKRPYLASIAAEIRLE
jgi:hypothetical protein